MKNEIKVPEDYKEVLDKELTYRLDVLPDKIREKEFEIVNKNKEIQKHTDFMKEIENSMHKLITMEGKYKAGSQQYMQVLNNRCIRDERFRNSLQKIEKLQAEVNNEKINLTYLGNKLKGTIGISNLRN